MHSDGSTDEALVVWAQDRPGRRDVYSTSEELHLPSSPAAYIALMVRELYTYGTMGSVSVNKTILLRL